VVTEKANRDEDIIPKRRFDDNITAQQNWQQHTLNITEIGPRPTEQIELKYKHR